MVRRQVFAVAAVSLFGAAGAAAEDPAAILAGARACTALANPIERVACYDAALVPSGATAQRTTGPQDSDPIETAAQPAPEESFGVTGDLLRKQRAATAPKEKDPSLEELTAPIAAIDTAASGDLVVRLGNGQVWRQIGVRRAPSLPKKSAAAVATITRLPLGGFSMRIEPGGATLRVRRVE